MSAVLLLMLVALLVAGTLGAWAWALDQRLRGGLLAQRREAMQRADWVQLRTVPTHVSAAFLTVVDPLFLERGVLRGPLEGSSVAQALVRQVYGLGSDVQGTARQLITAPLLASHLSRAELLELYLNRVYLGEDDGWPIYGIRSAARVYMGKDPGALTVGEAATLAGLLLPPVITEPESTPAAAGARRNEVLRQMRIEGSIIDEEYRAALAEPLAFQPGPEHAPMTRPTDWMREPEVIRVPASPMLAASPRGQ